MGADMGRQASQVSEDSASRFEKYVGVLTSVVGHAGRMASMHDYCVGLVAAEGCKSVEPMAAVTAPAGVSAQHQRLLHFVANAPWSDERMLAKVREMVVPEIERHGPTEVWIIDDTSFPKQGRHSVGVHHQYCGQLGKQANCQVAVTLSIANHHASLPIAYRLYLPREWAESAARRKRAHVPKAITFKTNISRRSRSSRSAQLGRRACRAVLCCSMRATVPIAGCAAASASWGSAMLLPSWRRSKWLRCPSEGHRSGA
jgi:SRSO17 transposase